MASPFSTNELFLRSDRIAFGKIPPEVPSREERLLIVPDVPGYKLFFGLSSLISTSGITGTLEDIYPQNASFTFDNFNKRLGINVSSPQYAIDISTSSGVRITGGVLIANAFGLQSVPTAALVSTLPSYVFAPGSIPPSAFASTGSINGISVATSALFSTLPTKLFSPNTIPLTTLQSTGIVYASSFIANSFYGDGFNISNIPLANINGEITGNFFKPNSFPLSTLASTGQIWIRDGSLFVPYLSAGQELVSSIQANSISTQRFITGSITASSFTAGVLNFTNLSSFTLATSSIVVSGGITAGSISGNGGGLTNLNPSALNNVIPSDKFGYQLIAWGAIIPFGPFQWVSGTVTFEADAPVFIKSTLRVEGATTLNTVLAKLYTGNGSGLFNLNAVSSLSLTSSLIGLGSINYISSSQLQSTVVGLSNLISSCIDDNELRSTLIGLGTFGYVSTSQLTSTVSQLTNNMISTTRGTDNQLISTTAGLNFYVSSFIDVAEVTSTIIGLGTFGYVSTSQLTSTVSQVTNNMISTTMGTDNQLISTTQGTDNQLISSVSQVTSNLFSTTRGTDNQLISSVSQVTSNLFSTTQGTDNQLISSVSQVTSNLFSTTRGTDNQLISSISQVTSNLFSTTRGVDNQLISTTRGTDNQLISTTRGTDNQLISTTTGTDNQLISSVSQLNSNLFSTTRGEDNQLISTTAGLAFYVSSFIDVPELTSTIIGLGSAGFVSTIGLDAKLASTVTGLGSANYISTLSLLSSVAGLQSTIDIAFSSYSTAVGSGAGEIVRSTVEGLGSAGYVSTLSLVSTVSQLTSNLLSTTAGLNFYVSSFIDVTELTSTLVALGSIGYLSTSQLTSTVSELTSNLLSTTIGEDNQLISTTAGLAFYVSSFIDVPELTSTIIGLGSLGFISSIGLDAKLASTVTGLGSADYISTLSLVSTVAGFQSTLDTSFSTYSTAVGPGGIDLIRSTVTGLGSIGYVSSLSLISTTAFFQNEIEYGFSTLSTAIQNFPGYNAQTLYLNQSVDVTPYKQLGADEVITTTLYSTITNVPGNTTGNLLCAFQSDFPLPSFMPGGIWDLNLFADAGTANAILIYYSLFFRASGGSETLLFQSGLVPIGNTGIQQYKNSLPVTYTSIPNGSTIVMKVFGSNKTSPTRTVTCYFQDSYYSHVHTTFDSVSYSGGSGVSSLSTVVASNYDYFSSLFVSTNLNLFSTVEGLGSIGYVSTLSMYSSINSAISSLSTAYGAVGGGGLASIPSTLSTFAILTSSLLASTIATGEFTTNPNFLSLQYPKRDPSTIFLYSLSSGYLGIGTSTPSNILEIKDWTPSSFTNSLLSLQVGTGGSTTYQATASNFYYYTGTQQSYNIPAGTSRLEFRIFGAGGESLMSAANIGGGGAYIEATLDVSSLYSVNSQFSNLYIVVGTGGNGGCNTPSADFWTGNPGLGANAGWSAGGGFTGIFLSNIGAPAVNTCNNTPIVIAGAGGGGGQGTSGAGGAATWSGTAWSGNNNARTTAAGAYGGGGGSQTQGGIAGGSPGSNGSYLRGGNSVPGAGAGYYGGGGGNNGSPSGGAGGGSSYITLSSFIISSTGDDAIGRSPGGLSGNGGTARSNSAYTGAGYGGIFGTSAPGSNGLVQIIAYQSVTLAKGVRALDIKNASGSILTAFTADGYLAINKSSPTVGLSLDVAGSAQISQLLTTSSLTTSRLTASVDASITSLSTGIITNSLRIGTLSSLTSINYNGLFGNYNNTVLAEISTGAGTQELLLFKGSSASDRVRVQTTGNFVVETGVSARLWSNTTIPTQSNVTPAFIINSSSNVGIQTATPGATLDVAGTARAITLSSQQLFVSSVNGGFPIVNAITNNSVLVLSYNSNYFSYDGNQFLTGTGIGNQVQGVGFNGSFWVAGTEAGTYRSGDGIIWSVTSFTGTPTSAVAWNGTIWVIGGYYGNMWYSYDGYTWIQSPLGPTTSAQAVVRDIAWGNDKFVAACAGAVYYSYDGLYWYNLGNILAGSDQTYCVAFNGLMWVIGGRFASVANIAYSYDGIRWINTSVTFNVTDIAWSGSIWVATTTTNQTVLTSPDGITWTSRTNANYTDLPANGGGSVTWNGSYFYVASGNSIIYLSRSSDGITWRSLGTIAGSSQMRKIRARYALPLNGVKQPAGIYAQNIFLGISTNQSLVRFPGGDGLYRNTVVGEISSTQSQYAQELVLFKGSTINDRIRLQTTGEIRFEAGVPSRFFSSISSIAPVVTPAFLISTNSNVGIGTALPAATLDVVGTGRFQNVSTLNINFSTINGEVFGAPINSTIIGLGSVGYVSSLSLVSTVAGLQSTINNSFSTYSTAVGPGGIDLIRSTVTGLGSIGYISSSQLFSTVIGLGQIYSSTMGGSSPSTLSTSAFFTSSILASTIQTIILSTQQLFASSIVTNNLLASTAMISSLSTNNVNFAGGLGYLLMPDIYPNSVYTSTVTTSNLLVGINSVVSPIQFYGFGTYSNSVIAEVSTGATTQELVFFRGSNATDRVRTQTTGSIVFEAGVSSRIWPTINSNATPSLIINTSSNVGIQTANPLFPLDVAGTGRFTTVSTLALNVSSVNGSVYPPTGGSSGAVPFISAFTVSTGFLNVSSISTNRFTANIINNLQFQTSSISTNSFFGGNINSLQIQTSSILGNNVLFASTQTTTISSASVYGSTFTGRWNDAQFYVLQTI